LPEIVLEKESLAMHSTPEKILRALKDEFAKFGGALSEKKIQLATSMRDRWCIVLMDHPAICCSSE